MSKIKNQNGFTRTNFLPEQEDFGGFIPLLIALAIILAAVVWVAYKHVSSVQK